MWFFLALPDNEYASSWSLSMEQCKKSQTSTYLLGDFNMSNPHLVCSFIPRSIQVVWVGVVRQKYTSIDQGIYKYLTRSSTQQTITLIKLICGFFSNHNLVTESQN